MSWFFATVPSAGTISYVGFLAPGHHGTLLYSTSIDLLFPVLRTYRVDGRPVNMGSPLGISLCVGGLPAASKHVVYSYVRVVPHLLDTLTSPLPAIHSLRVVASHLLACRLREPVRRQVRHSPQASSASRSLCPEASVGAFWQRALFASLPSSLQNLGRE